MSPTLHPGDFLWIRKTNTFHRGQIALLKQRNEEFHLKRIVGMPGESIQIRAGSLRIGGQTHAESYVPEASHLQPESDRSWVLGASGCIVLGDARDDSLDSRKLGPVTLDQILGVAVFRLWPPPFAL